MASRPTTIRFSASDLEHVQQLQKETGIQSVSEVLRLSLRRAVGALDRVDAQMPDPVVLGEQLRTAVEAHQAALALWEPTDFAGARAKARVEEAMAELEDFLGGEPA